MRSMWTVGKAAGLRRASSDSLSRSAVLRRSRRATAVGTALSRRGYRKQTKGTGPIGRAARQAHSAHDWHVRRLPGPRCCVGKPQRWMRLPRRSSESAAV